MKQKVIEVRSGKEQVPSQITQNEPNKDNPQRVMREAEERQKFEKSQFVQKQAMKAFKEVKQHEFRLINMYRPESLTANFDAFLTEYQDKERSSALQIDTKKFKDREQR